MYVLQSCNKSETLSNAGIPRHNDGELSQFSNHPNNEHVLTISTFSSLRSSCINIVQFVFDKLGYQHRSNFLPA